MKGKDFVGVAGKTERCTWCNFNNRDWETYMVWLILDKRERRTHICMCWILLREYDNWVVGRYWSKGKDFVGGACEIERRTCEILDNRDRETYTWSDQF